MKKRLTLLFLIPIFMLTGCLSDYVQTLVGEDVYTDYTPFKQYFADYKKDLEKEVEEGSKKYDEEAQKIIEKTKLGYGDDELAFFIPNEYDRENIKYFNFIEHRNIGNTNYLVYAYQASIKNTDKVVSVLYRFDCINREGQVLYSEEHDIINADKFLSKKTETLIDEEAVYEVFDDFKLLIINVDGEILSTLDMRDTFYDLVYNYEEARANSRNFAKKTNELVADKIEIKDFVLDRYGNVYLTVYKKNNINIEEFGEDSYNDMKKGDEEYTTICCYSVTKQELLFDRTLVKTANNTVIYAPFNVYFDLNSEMIDDSTYVCCVNDDGVYGVRKIIKDNGTVGNELYFVSYDNYKNSSVWNNKKIKKIGQDDLFSYLHVQNYIAEMVRMGTINDYVNSRKLRNCEYYYKYSFDYDGDYFEELPNLVEEVSDEFNVNRDLDLFNKKEKTIIQDYREGKYVYFNSCNEETWSKNRIFPDRPTNYLFIIEPMVKREMIESTAFGYGVFNNDDKSKMQFTFKYLENDELNYYKVVEDGDTEYNANNDSDFKQFNLNFNVNDDFLNLTYSIDYKSNYEIVLLYKSKIRILRYDRENKIFDKILNYNDLFLIDGATNNKDTEYDTINVSWVNRNRIVLSSYMFGTVLYDFDEDLAYRLDDCAVYAAYLDESGELFCVGTKLDKQVLYQDIIKLTYFKVDLSANNYIQNTVKEMLRDSAEYIEKNLYRIDFYEEFDSFLVNQKATASIAAKNTLENIALLVKKYKNDIELLNYYLDEADDSEKEKLFYNMYDLDNYINVKKYFLKVYSKKYPESLKLEKVTDAFEDSYMNELAQEINTEYAIMNYIVEKENDARGVFEIESEIGVDIELFTVEEFEEILQKTSDHIRDIKYALKNVEN